MATKDRVSSISVNPSMLHDKEGKASACATIN